jgi:antirestriction protein
MSPKARGETPQIYVADLAAYAAGTLHGEWIDATQDADDIKAAIQEMLRASPDPGAEEWAIHDYEGFGGLRLSEFEDLETVSKVANLIQEHGPVFAALVDHYGGTQYLDDAIRAMEEGYQGEYDDVADWAERFAEDTGASMENYQSYIDWERVGRDAELGGDIIALEVDGKVHVFWANT